MLRSLRNVRRAAIPTVMLLCAASAPAVAALSSALPLTSSLHLKAGAGWRLVAEERLGPNLVLDRWRGPDAGVAAVAYPGSSVEVTRTAPRDRQGHRSISVSIVSGLSGKTMNSVPLTPEQELLRLGVPMAQARAYAIKEVANVDPGSVGTKVNSEAANPPRDAPCVTLYEDYDSNGHARVYAYGCDRQYLDYSNPNDPGQWYLADDFQVSGDTQDTALFYPDHLTDLTGGVVYSSGNRIIKWDPSVTEPVGNCSVQKTHIGGTYSGLDASYDQESYVCPDSFGPKTFTQLHFSSHWAGQDKTQGWVEQTIGNDYVDNPPYTAATVHYYVTVSYCAVSCT